MSVRGRGLGLDVLRVAGLTRATETSIAHAPIADSCSACAVCRGAQTGRIRQTRQARGKPHLICDGSAAPGLLAIAAPRLDHYVNHDARLLLDRDGRP